MSEDPLAVLAELAEVRERDFTSDVPVLGPAIVWVRTQWNNVAARWYVRAQVSQQNTFNDSVVAALRDLVTRINEAQAGIAEQVSVLERIAAQIDGEQMELARDVAEVRYQLIRLAKAMRAEKHPCGNADTTDVEG